MSNYCTYCPHFNCIRILSFLSYSFLNFSYQKYDAKTQLLEVFSQECEVLLPPGRCLENIFFFNMFSAVIKFFKSFTVEPLVFFFVFAEYLVLGSELQTNLMMWKVCNIELGLNETICDNLDLEENDEYETIVQRRVNDFMMVRIH